MRRKRDRLEIVLAPDLAISWKNSKVSNGMTQHTTTNGSILDPFFQCFSHRRNLTVGARGECSERWILDFQLRILRAKSK